MQKIDFVNATHPAINDTNLNQMQDNIETAINAQVSGDTLPIGAIIPWATTIAPNQNWLVCNGQAVSRTTYSQLFNIIGTQYGVGDGSTTFNVPDLRGRHPMGFNLEDTDFSSIGKTGGEKNHTMTVSELVEHNHTVAKYYANTEAGGNAVMGSNATGTGVTTTNGIGTTGGGQPFNVLDPYLTTNYIIKAFQTAGVVAEVVNARNNSQTKVYSTSYVNGIADYSTTEKVCGTWIDGKPIYRKVLVTTWGDRDSSSQNISVSNLNIDTMVNMTGKVSYSNGWHALGGYANANFYSLIQYNYREYNVQLYGKGYTNANIVLIIEYTKTTD